MLIFSINSFSQANDPLRVDEKVSKDSQPVILKKDSSPLSRTPFSNYSSQENEIIEQMNQIKRPDNFLQEGEKILELQKKLEATNGSTVTRQETNPIGTLIPANRYNPQETDDISSTTVFDYAGNYIFGIAAQVEQRGATAGKIWLAVALAHGDTNAFGPPDTLAVYNSINDGTTYNLYAKIAFSSYNRNDFDNIDIEIIENTSGTKYLYIVFGYTTNGGRGQKLIGYTVLSAPTLGYFGSGIVFPGHSTAHSYTKARITSDNARFPGNPYVTIVVTQDSLVGLDHYVMSKICRVLSPFTLTPSITYLPQSIYTPVEGFIDNDVMTDVANYHNGSDSLIFVLSKYEGFRENIYLYKAFSNATVYPTYSGTFTPSGNNLEIARVAANGGTDQTKIIITYSDDHLNSGDFNQWILYSYDASNWGANILDNTTYNKSRYGDVIGRRNADGSFEVAFKNIFGNMENVSSYGFTDFTLSSSMHSLNTEYANSTANPKPCFRYIRGDSCLNIWSYYYTLYSTGGCSVSNLYVTLGIEGMYNEATGYHIGNVPVILLLADANPPYNILDTGFAYLDYATLTNAYAFPRALTGDFYLIAKHYNCIETWSAAPVHVEPASWMFYDFTTSDAQAYGNNMTLKGTRWCIYSGDVNQDGNIDGEDLQKIDNDAYSFTIGLFYVSDLNGDTFVDGADYLIGDNNAFNFVTAVTP